ncbi:hypothetical protein [Paenibacillus sp. YN15]|uniref:hypothetical protein n=1 Tax=Paenibacillus sp. YN15 TaxID=1742774 RepID=UPI000DCF41A8|nr:hypothetical protein [Paenibacillus sp. YN15]RAU92730.1 hypothetical protein DQG13_27145 [Paenibacillus sp. YN15]
MKKSKIALLTLFTTVALSIALPITISATNEPSNVESTIKTKQNQVFLTQNNIILKTPDTKSKISEEEAINLALKYCDALKPDPSNIAVEYQLMTYSNFHEFSEAAKSKNQKLKEEGYLNNTPVYIVTLKGLNFPSMGGRAQGSKIQHIILHEKNVIIDADTGEILFT